MTPSSRHYALRLQYRVGNSGPFLDLEEDGQPVEYLRNAVAGDSTLRRAVPLPAVLLDQPYVQLRWIYYWQSGRSGPRDQLRLDDITVSGPVPAPSLTSVGLEPGGNLRLRFTGLPDISYYLENSANLEDWIGVGILDAEGDGMIEYVTGTGDESKSFFRLVWP